MLSEVPFTKDNIDSCLKELAKEYRRLNGRKIPAEIILVGGASVLINYGFRDVTNDIDAIIFAASAMKEAIRNVGDRLGLPYGWLNSDFKNTNSYSDKLPEFSVYYKTFSNVLTIRTVSAEYLIAMKLVSGRQYKYDLSDIAGILLEHQKAGNPISRDKIDRAVTDIYGSAAQLPPASVSFLDKAFAQKDYEQSYFEIRGSETQAMSVLEDFDRAYPNKLKTENIADIIDRAKKKKSEIRQSEAGISDVPDMKQDKSHEL